MQLFQHGYTVKCAILPAVVHQDICILPQVHFLKSIRTKLLRPFYTFYHCNNKSITTILIESNTLYRMILHCILILVLRPLQISFRYSIVCTILWINLCLSCYYKLTFFIFPADQNLFTSSSSQQTSFIVYILSRELWTEESGKWRACVNKRKACCGDGRYSTPCKVLGPDGAIHRVVIFSNFLKMSVDWHNPD